MDDYDKILRTIDRLAQEMPGRIGKDFGTWGEVFDAPTVMTLHRFLRNDILRSLDYPISTGKEANVFKATGGEGDPVAVKIYRVHTSTFRKMLPYIEGDPRFRKVPRDHRGLIHAWAKKEYRNLERFREAGVDVPIPYKSLNNVVIMEFLGDPNNPPRTIKAEPLEDAQAGFDKIWNDYQRLIEHARSIHADLSEYNILNVEGAPRIIDVAQAVLVKHPMSEEFLERDLVNVSKYFAKQGAEVDLPAMRQRARELVTAAGEDEDEEEEII